MTSSKPFSGKTLALIATMATLLSGIVQIAGVSALAAPDRDPSIAPRPTTVATATATPTPTSVPTPTPLLTVADETTTAPIPFSSTTVEDPTAASGTEAVTVEGVDGVVETTWRVSYVDGVEREREKIAERTARDPITRIVAVGTYVAPPPPPPAPAVEAPNSVDTGTVVPGGFCPDGAQGVTATADNGRSYMCGGKGPDANGRLHWNTLG